MRALLLYIHPCVVFALYKPSVSLQFVVEHKYWKGMRRRCDDGKLVKTKTPTDAICFVIAWVEKQNRFRHELLIQHNYILVLVLPHLLLATVSMFCTLSSIAHMHVDDRCDHELQDAPAEQQRGLRHRRLAELLGHTVASPQEASSQLRVLTRCVSPHVESQLPQLLMWTVSTGQHYS